MKKIKFVFLSLMFLTVIFLLLYYKILDAKDNTKDAKPQATKLDTKSQDSKLQMLSAEVINKVETYIRKIYNIPSTTSIKVGEVTSSEIPNIKKIKIEFRDDKGNLLGSNFFYLTSDNKFLIQGKIMNLTVDPFKETMKKIKTTNRPQRGPDNAKVTILIYSDFQCPHCSKALPLEEEILKTYGDKVRLIFKNYPLERIHPWAKEAAESASCAFLQNNNSFWDMHKLLFERQGQITEKNFKEKILGIAKEINLNIESFQNCLDKKLARNIVEEDIKEAENIEVRSVPTFVINGQMLTGVQSINTFKQIIDKEL